MESQIHDRNNLVRLTDKYLGKSHELIRLALISGTNDNAAIMVNISKAKEMFDMLRHDIASEP